MPALKHGLMTAVLSHISALEYWRTSRGCGCVRAEVPHAKALTRRPSDFDHPLPATLHLLSRPLSVLASGPQSRRRNDTVVSRSWSFPLYKGSVIDTGEGFFVSSPELCFIQMAASMSLIELIQLGFEFCGRYDLADGSLHACQPLTSTALLENVIAKYKGATGINKAERAVKYVIDNSASPMETALAMLLSLPYQLGGYNFEKPSLNRRIDKGGDRRGSTLSDYFVCDLMWDDARVVLEYDSDMFHAGTDNQTRDSIRRAEIERMGYTVISVTRPQVASDMGIRNLAVLLAKQMGRRLRIPEPEFSSACHELRKALLRPT